MSHNVQAVRSKLHCRIDLGGGQVAINEKSSVELDTRYEIEKMRFFRILRKTENPKSIFVPKRTKLILGTNGDENYYGGQNNEKNKYYHKMVADRLIPICK